MKRKFSFISVVVALTLILTAGIVPHARAYPPGGEKTNAPCPTPKDSGPKGSAIRLAAGDLTDSYVASVVESAQGPTLQFSLVFHSYNADGSRAEVDTVLGYGWTHSYNVFLFFQRGHVFRWDGEGRITKFQLGPGGSYTADQSWFETLIRNPDGSFTITGKDKTVSRFAAVPGTPFMVEGPVLRLQSITDRNGNTTALMYSGGNLMQITDPYGRSLSLTYNASNKLAQVTDPLGHTNSFSYDSSGRRLARITDPAGKSIVYAYNARNQPLSKVDRDGRVFVYGYANGRPVRISDGSSVSRVLLLNSNNWATDSEALTLNLLRVYVPGTTVLIDGLGHRWQYDYDTNGYVLNAKAPDGATTSYAYDPSTLKLAAVTDPMGRATAYSYDALGNPLAVTNALGDVTRYTYDPVFNQVTSMTDPNGRITTWQYDARGNRTNEISPAPFFYTRSWTYDGHGNLLTEKDRNGNTTHYSYDQFGCRTNRTDALGNVTTFRYDSGGNVIARIDANLHASTYTYDALNRLVAETNGLTIVGPLTSPHANVTSPQLTSELLPDGGVRIAWEGNGYTLTHARSLAGPFEDVLSGELPVTVSPYLVFSPLTTSSEFFSLRSSSGAVPPDTAQSIGFDFIYRPEGDPANGAYGPGQTDGAGSEGEVRTYTYDGEGNRTSATDGKGNSTLYEYDLRKRLVKTTDALGYTVSYAYDNNDNRIAVTNQNGFVTRYEYDAQNRLIRTIDALGCPSTRDYDSAGNVIRETDANSHSTGYSYDELNRRTALTNALGGVTLFEYAGAGAAPCCSPTFGSGLVTKQTDANGNITYFTYDELDRLAAVVHKQGDNANLIDGDDAVTAYSYDPNGDRLTVATRISDTDWITNWFRYDALRRPIAGTNGAGEVTLTSYDPVGNVRVVQTPNLNLATNTYDARDRLIQVDDALGRVLNHTYDAIGLLLTTADGNGNGPTNRYDALHRLVTVTDAMGASMTHTYDTVGNLLQTTDRMGHSTQYAYDAVNRRTNITDALGCTSHFTYDCVGNLLAVTDAKNHTTSYEYDALNRRVKETYPDVPGPSELPDSNKRFFTYDAVGHVSSLTDQKGVSILLRYDDLYRLTQRDYPADDDDFYTYDLAGRMVTARKAGWLVSFAYDGASRVTNAVQGDRVFSYKYDAVAGQLSTHYPGGVALVETGDARGRLARISDGRLVPLAAYTYDAGDVVLSRVQGNGTVASYAHNANRWVTSIRHTLGPELLAGFDYLYDREGNRLTEKHPHQPSTSATYDYDSVDRLVDNKVGTITGGSIPSPLSHTQYALDCLGNWDQRVTNGVAEVRQHNGANEIVSANGVDFSHDPNGNLNDDGNTSLSYDQANHLVFASNHWTAVTSLYRYDALGRRIAKEVHAGGTATTNLYFYDHSRLVEEQSASGATVATYVYGNYIDEVICQIRPGATCYFHQNALWSVAALSDESGGVLERYAYDPYGRTIEADSTGTPLPPNAYGWTESTVGNLFMFTGRQFDPETGCYHFRQRAYSPQLGRFLQRDVLGYLDGLNLYEYVRGRPTLLLDPSGGSAGGGKYGIFNYSYDYKVKKSFTTSSRCCPPGTAHAGQVRDTWTLGFGIEATLEGSVATMGGGITVGPFSGSYWLGAKATVGATGSAQANLAIDFCNDGDPSVEVCLEITVYSSIAVGGEVELGIKYPWWSWKEGWHWEEATAKAGLTGKVTVSGSCKWCFTCSQAGCKAGKIQCGWNTPKVEAKGEVCIDDTCVSVSL